MVKIYRLIEESIISGLRKEGSKVHIIYGARQVGKTTLAKKIIGELGYRTLEINSDELLYNEILSSQSHAKLEGLVSGYEMIFIDEAQRITNIGINLKILHDTFPDLKILVTGSSSFELANRVTESLTGRTRSYTLYPLALCELAQYFNHFELIHSSLPDLLVYGSYPDIFSEKNTVEKGKSLLELTRNYLYKDIFLLEQIQYPEKLTKLLQLLAFQIGGEVSIHELSNTLGIHRDTVIRYIYLLEQAFIIYRISGFSRELRREVSKMDKIYFWDLGIRNTLIGNINSLENRSDIGQLWENFIINERIKLCQYTDHIATHHFWRKHTGAEIDLVEESGGKLHAYEIKWKKRTAKIPSTFLRAYPESTFSVIHSENCMDFIAPLESHPSKPKKVFEK